MKKEILILVDYNNFLRNAFRHSSTIDLDTIGAVLKKNNFKVEFCSYQDIIQGKVKPENKYIWYGSTDATSYKRYIEDIIHFLRDKNTLIPSFDIFRCHNNKGYQALMREKYALSKLWETYFGTYEELKSMKKEFSFPIVLKKTKGSGSRDVHLIKSQQDLYKSVKRISRKPSFLINLAKNYLKRYIFTKKYTYDNSRESLHYENFVLQEFIPGLSNDWKVLIFFDKYYVLERGVRKKDFRASGSGKGYYRDFNMEMLDFSKEVFDKLKSPWLALDICYDGDKFHLVEFQGISLGPTTFLKAPYYFKLGSDQKWNKISEKSDLSTEYAEAVAKHIIKIIS